MRRVDITVDICLEGGIDSNDTESTSYLRTVGGLLRTKQELVTIEIEVSQYFRHLALYETQRATRSELTMSGFDKIHYGVLDDFGVHLKRRDMRVFTELTEYGVGYVAHSTLDRQERSRNTSGFHLSLQEHCYIRTDLGSGLIHRRESCYLVRTVGLHNGSNLSRVYFDMIRAAAIRGLVDRNLATLRRVERLIEIVHTAHRSREHLIEFDDDLIRHAADGRHDSDTCSRHDRTVFAYIRSLDDRPVGFGQEAVTQILRHVAQVHVEIVGTFGIDLVAHGFIGLIRRTELHGVRTCQSTITAVSHRSACLETYAEGLAFCMEAFCALCEGKRNRLGHSGSRETTHAQNVTMLYQFSRFFSGHIF